MPRSNMPASLAAAVQSTLPDGVVEALNDGIVVLDSAFRISWVNAVAERLLRLPEGPLVGRSLWSAAPALRGTQLPDLCCASQEHGTPNTVELQLEDVGGSWLEVRIFSLADGGLLLTARDVTERVRSLAECDRLLALEAEARQTAERAAHRLQVLQSLTAKLSEAVTIEDVVDVVVGAAVGTVGAGGAVVALPEGARSLHLVAFTGFERQVEETYRYMDVDAEYPIAKAFRTRRAEWLESSEALARAYPSLGEGPTIFEAVAALPLCVFGRTLGAVVLTFHESRTFDSDDRALLEAIAHQCAIAIDRAQTFAREHRMLEEARAAERRSRFLAEATALVSASLDYRVTLDSIARLAVPTLADWCAVDMLMPDGEAQRLAITHPNPDKIELASELAKKYPPDRNAPSGLWHVIKTGEPEWVREIPDEVLTRAARDEEHLRVIRELGLRSYICVPIVRRGVVRGAISLVYAESGRLYDEADFRLALEVARQASIAVDNALLYEEARDAIRLRDEFLSVASHELKTPLTPLQLRLQSLVREAPADDRTRNHVDVVQRQIRKLATLIDGLLDVSRISAGRLQLDLEEVDLAALVRDVVSRWEPEAARTGASIAVHAPRPLHGRWDRTRLEQVAGNLVSNAIKYGAGKPITVRLERRGHAAVFEVHDSGIGIAPEHLARIFQRFERAVSGRNYGGLGLGLYITRRIVEALGGTISVESTPEQGSTFAVRLPIRAT